LEHIETDKKRIKEWEEWSKGEHERVKAAEDEKVKAEQERVKVEEERVKAERAKEGEES